MYFIIRSENALSRSSLTIVDKAQDYQSNIRRFDPLLGSFMRL